MTARYLKGRFDSIAEGVGRTPLVRLRNVVAQVPGIEVYAKLECANPGGSVKDRAALRMMTDALKDGRLNRSKVLIDSTSGNTGVAYSLFGAALGLKIQLVMPSNVSQARKDIAQAYGTEIIYSDPMEGSDGAIRLVREIVAKEPGRYFYPDQYSNPGNPLAHFDGTAPEILAAVGPKLTHFVAGLGTSGTMMGTARRMRQDAPHVKCVAIEPDEPMHGLEGLKHMASSLVPAIYDIGLPHEHRGVSTEDGWDMADRVVAEEGMHVGHSSGANIFAAARIADEVAARGERGCIVAIVCDRGDRYFAPMRWEKKYVW
jgi:cysteine synthase B